MKFLLRNILFLFISLLLYFACTKKNAPNAVAYGEGSSATGLEYKKTDSTFHPDQANANEPYDPKKYKRPNMRLIEGGRSLLGFEESEFTHSKIKYFTTTVETFYMDETEIANIHWLEYLWHLRKVSEQEYVSALPDTLVWSRQFSFNDFYVENYLRHPAFRFYPVVGVSWLQANEYCKWRTDPQWHKLQFVKKEGTGKKIQLSDTLWVYEGYKTALPQKVPKPEYRLPTEAEWIYAAICFSYMVPYIDEKEFYRRVYPWDGNSMRNPYKKGRGNFLANFKRGRGDYGGVAGYRNDGAVYTEYIYAYPPNDVGLYNMAGNVNEWVQELWDHVPMEVDKFEFNSKLDESEEKKLIKEQATFEEYLEEERFRVYKGGSWNDVAYYLSPFSRRKLAEDSSSSTIGFRCAMSVFPEKD
ncbi:MAG: SUMF1/EgtB/PvdO family nonheme iron enzyme [Bacteroidota bacterium]|nr:SUMF1/EgtB/PvdO family nonheme iron enzyme [Bacteroidota bacterium]